MSNEPQCPDRDELERFLLGQVSDLELADIEGHLSHCSSCLRTLEDLHAQDPLIEAFRSQRAARDNQEDEQAESMIRRLQGLSLLTVNVPSGKEPSALAETMDNLSPSRFAQTRGSLASPAVLERGMAPPPTRPGRSRLRWLLLLLLLAVLVVGWLFGPSLYRRAANRGELVVETDRDVLAVLSQDGRRVRIVHAETTRSLDMPAGDYEVEVVEAPGGAPVNRQHLHLPRGGRAVISTAPAARVYPLTLRGSGDPIRGLAFSPDGRMLAAAGKSQPTVWDLATGREKLSLEDRTGLWFAGLAFSPDGKRLAAGTWTHARVWDVESGSLLVRKELPGEIYSLDCSPDGRYLLSASVIWNAGGPNKHRSYVLAWKMGTWENHLVYASDVEGVYSCARYSPDGEQVAAILFQVDARGDMLPESLTRVWKAESGELLHDLPCPRGELLSSLAFSPDSRLVARAGAERTIRFWDAKTGKELPVLRDAGERLRDVAFSPDGRRLLSGGDDAEHELRLWDVETRKLIRTFRQKHVTYKVAFSPDGRLVAAGGGNDVTVWDTTQSNESTPTREVP